MKYEWNKPFNMVMKIKSDYEKLKGEIDNCNFENWITELNNQEYKISTRGSVI